MHDAFESKIPGDCSTKKNDNHSNMEHEQSPFLLLYHPETEDVDDNSDAE